MLVITENTSSLLYLPWISSLQFPWESLPSNFSVSQFDGRGRGWNIDDAMRAFVNNSSCSLVAACCCCRSTCAVRHDTCPRGGMLDWLSLLATSSWFNYRSQAWMVCECVRVCVVFVSAGKCVLWHVNHPPLALSISGHDNWSCYHNFVAVAVAVAVARSWSRSPYQGCVSGSLAPSA